MSKITRATFKSFIKKNLGNLYLKVKSEFDGMTDGVEQVKGEFEKVKPTVGYFEHKLNISGLWLVGHRDYFENYDDGIYTGIAYSNCCGSGVVAIKKEASK